MSVITPAPQPKSDIFREVEQLQNSFKNNESKVLVDNNKIYKKCTCLFCKIPLRCIKSQYSGEYGLE